MWLITAKSASQKIHSQLVTGKKQKRNKIPKKTKIKQMCGKIEHTIIKRCFRLEWMDIGWQLC